MASISKKSGRRGVGRHDEGDEVYDFGNAAAFEDDKGAGARFLSVDDDGGWTAEFEGKPILERLAEKAAAAVDARKPKVKKREIKAQFGGVRGAIADSDSGGQGPGGGLDAVEAEFLRELQENVPQSFLSPQDADEDEDEDDLRGAAPFFFTEDVWEDIDYNQRKQSIVQQLADASDRIAEAQVALPQLKVDNDRLQHMCRQLEREAQELEDQEKKIFLRYPDFKKRYNQTEKDGDEEDFEAQQAAREALDAEQERERRRQDARLRRRIEKRRNLAVQGLHRIEVHVSLRVHVSLASGRMLVFAT